jgi:predicted nicotinamide N-methyase
VQDDKVTLVQFVRSATLLAPVPLVPEISLYQAADVWAVWQQTERELGQAELPPPFWGVAWPGGQALARYLLDHPDLVAGRSALDLGSGSGLVAIAAAMAGARSVLASETDPLASTAIELNAAANGIGVPACVGDFGDATLAADVVLGGDIWYERDLADRVTAFFDRSAAAGALVLAGDIGRRYFPRNRYRRLASYQLQASADLEGSELLTASIWQASGPDAADPQRAAADLAGGGAKCRASSVSNS